jgi:hypothetical protein
MAGPSVLPEKRGIKNVRWLISVKRESGGKKLVAHRKDAKIAEV